jgi:hypothetical protein
MDLDQLIRQADPARSLTVATPDPTHITRGGRSSRRVQIAGLLALGLAVGVVAVVGLVILSVGAGRSRRPAGRSYTEAQVRARVTVRELPAQYYCDPRGPDRPAALTIPCNGAIPRGYFREQAPGSDQLLVYVSWTARAPVTNVNDSSYAWSVNYPRSCGSGGEGSGTQSLVKSGQRITRSFLVPRDRNCAGRDTGEIQYIPNLGPDGQRSHLLKGAELGARRLKGALLVGRFAFTVPPCVAGCGGRSTSVIVHPAGAVWCPTTTRPINAKQNKSNSPGAGSFDTRTLLGLKESAATADAQRHGCTVRVIERDGHKFGLLADFISDRVDVVISSGIVTSVGVY